MQNASPEEPRREPNGAVAAWLDRLRRLIDDVRRWCENAGWSTRVIPKRMKEADVGAYEASALLLQEGTTRVLLEPIARSAPGAEGVVDLYFLPAYDDIASLYWHDGGWKIHYMYPESPTVGDIRAAEAKDLSEENLLAVLDEMRKHVAGSV